MSYVDHLEEQSTHVSEFLNEKFKLDTETFDNFNEYLDVYLRNIISIKIWSKHIKENKAMNYNQDHYLDEIVSNLNQSLILGAIGFKIPAYMMIRRSMENILGFLFYMEHPVEYIIKEREPLKRADNKLSEYKEYFKNYPYYVKFEDSQIKQLKQIILKIMDAWSAQYRELSNFVHATNSDHLELTDYLEKIVPSNETMISLTQYVTLLGTLVNTLNLIFFNDVYLMMDDREKAFIRKSISEHADIKKGLAICIGI